MNIFRHIRIATGDRLVSKSGRDLAPVPRLVFDSVRSCNASLHRLFEWLIAEARAEADARQDDYARILFAKMQPKNLSQADKHLLNDYLFGDPDGASERHRRAA